MEYHGTILHDSEKLELLNFILETLLHNTLLTFDLLEVIELLFNFFALSSFV